MNENLKEVIKLLENNDEEIYPVFAYSILNKYINGQFYLDELEKSLLIRTDSGIFVVAGDEMNKDFYQLLKENYNIRKNANERFTLFSPSQKWDQAINELFGKELKQIYRYSFQFNKGTYSSIKKSEIPKEFTLVEMDEKTITKSIDFNESYFNEYWGSVSKFLENGFGYCLLHSETVVSECTSIFCSPQYAEIDITTQEKYRGMGLGQKVAEIFMERCIEKRINPKWDCDINNVASIKMAERLGFENPIKYSIYVRR
ncbi:GNAT family N-acetyltransferase [Psychrobacillus sp.]|uniref:GNAT family N-acetyltransferase n=1 Tax=Psychrobacillus sp. TaxID=1871623 RepID=UPI0028BD1AF6|nr:GNAT family N-acetyltransferase [Psychrobacillus sp.]